MVAAIFCSASFTLFMPLDTGRVSLRSNNNKVIVHQVMALNAISVSNEFFLIRLGVTSKHIAIAVAGIADRLASADSNNIDQ